MPSNSNHSPVLPPTGAPPPVACAQSHTNGNYPPVPKDSYPCHTTDFTGTNNPSHVQLNLPHTCDTCHTTTNWLNAKFDHTLYGHWALTGAHATVQCAQCHVNNNYGALPTTCVSCHQTDYNNAMNPPHVSGKFPTDCLQCHNTSSWTAATFNHNNTSFPLTGFHTTVACATCHTPADNYKGTLPTTCYGCHQKDFTATTNTAHAPV